MIDEMVLAKWEKWMKQDDCWKYASEPKDIVEMLGEIRRLRTLAFELEETIRLRWAKWPDRPESPEITK